MEVQVIKKLILLIFLLYPCSCFASNVTLVWDMNSEPDMKEYRIYMSYGTTQNFTLVKTITHPTHEGIVSDLQDGDYTFVVTAVDTENLESGYSNEVTAHIDTQAPAPPSNLIMQLIEKIFAWFNGLFNTLQIKMV